jgi:hypothetical protein
VDSVLPGNGWTRSGALSWLTALDLLLPAQMASELALYFNDFCIRTVLIRTRKGAPISSGEGAGAFIPQYMVMSAFCVDLP